MTERSRIGIGHDTHRLAPGGPLRLGGLSIDHDQHLVGHSDADVLLHAVTDALLGALARGDIGDWFPDTASENRDRDSVEFLRAAMQEVHSAGYVVGNLDCIVFAQRPKLASYKRPLRQRLAELLDVDVTRRQRQGQDGGGRRHHRPRGSHRRPMRRAAAIHCYEGRKQDRTRLIKILMGNDCREEP